MPKTRNAFAFRGYDEQRILSRPYFREFRAAHHVDENLSDDQIVSSFSASDGDSADALEQKLQSAKAAYNRLSEFRKFVNRHVETRLDPYNRRKAEKAGVKLSELSKLKRAAPVMDYFITIFRARDLMDRLTKIYYELEDEIEKRYRKEFAARLKMLRRAAGLTQKQLGDLIQISPQGFSMYETGRRDPSIPSLIRLAKVLDVKKLLGVK